MIAVQNLTKSFGLQILLNEVSFSVNRGERVGFVGRNGHGKSTLFRIILGLEECDSGMVSIPKNYRIGHLDQEIVITKPTLLEEGCTALKERHTGEEWRVEKILMGLGFGKEEFGRDPAELSGGYQVRMNLAKVLVSEPDMLLLDEPTNYLDILSIRWLTRFLKEWSGELMLITHDRGFMDAVVTHTLAIHRQKIRKVEGVTGKVYDQIYKEEETYEKTRINDEKKRRDTELYIRRFRAKARLAGMVQSRIKELARSEKLERLEKMETLEFSFQAAPFEARVLGEVEDLHYSYQESQPDLTGGVGFTILPGERICVVGQNGKGKSTLLKLLASKLKPKGGRVAFHPAVTAGYYAQTNEKELDPSRTVVEELMHAGPGCTEERARTLAGLFMFSGDMALKKIEVLSGGEKSRVLLAKLMLSPAHFLLLDEPTNHLDMESCDALLAAIDAFDGAVVIVTHNEKFLRELATRLVVFDREKVFMYESSYDNFLADVGWEEDSEATPRTKQENQERGSDRVESRRARARLVQERSREMNRLKEQIQDLEREIETREEELSENNIRLVAASTEGEAEVITSLAKRNKELIAHIPELYDRLDELTSQHEERESHYEKQFAGITGT